MGSHALVPPSDENALNRSETRDHVLPSRTIDLITKVGSPIAVATAFLFYFGWTRANAQARALGYDVTLLGLTTSDYVLRSINALFVPIMLVLVLALAGCLVHPFIVDRLEMARSRGSTRGLLLGLRLGWLWMPALSLVVFAVAPTIQTVVLPLGLALGILVAIYGARLDRHVYHRQPPPIWIRAVVWILLGVVIFWATERIANLFGQRFAEYISVQPDDYAKIAIVSPQRLALSGPKVREVQIGDQDAEYRYRYEGLRLLLYSNDKYFLLSYSDAEPLLTVIVLPDDNRLRVEFTR
jgi:hypothetical protein